MFIYNLNVYSNRPSVAPGETLVAWNDVWR